jgi:hypothetical protein
MNDSYTRLAAHCRAVASTERPISPAVYAGALLHAAMTLEAWASDLDCIANFEISGESK